MKRITPILLMTLVAAVVPALAAGPSTHPAAAKVRIALVGDSTVTDSAGWGPGFAALLTSDAECVNLALGGRSSKSYRDEGHWAKVLATDADYVLLQFGHNDQPGKGPARETDPETTYRANMKRYVDELQAAGMKPVLVTSLTRRNFNPDGTLRDTLAPYVNAVKKLAAETNTPVIDLHANSTILCQKFGPTGCEAISPRNKDGTVDATHLNAEGARVIGPLVARELRTVVPELARYIQNRPPAQTASIPPDITVAADGSGDFTSVHAAVQSIPQDNRDRVVIFIKDGVYRERVRVDADRVTLLGQSRKGTRIEFPLLREDWEKNRDDIGQAVVNLRGDDTVLANLTIHNTAGVVGPHAFAVYGKSDRTVVVDCDLLSDGADTVSLWQGDHGRYYHARCHFRGAVDFVCPRGWCYIADSTFYETKATAALWHDGSKDRDQKFVLRNCRFDGVDGWNLARHHHDAAFYLLDCTFSQSMIDRAPYRVIYPLEGKTPTTQDVERNKELEKTNRWGERAYFHNCHRDGGDYAWHTDNLSSAPGSPTPGQVTAKWTFAGKWDPESTVGPNVTAVADRDGQLAVTFGEHVTVKGNPRLVLPGGKFAEYASGSGTDTLLFVGATGKAESLDLNGGAIIASEASASTRTAALTLPTK